MDEKKNRVLGYSFLLCIGSSSGFTVLLFLRWFILVVVLQQFRNCLTHFKSFTKQFVAVEKSPENFYQKIKCHIIN